MYSNNIERNILEFFGRLYVIYYDEHNASPEL